MDSIFGAKELIEEMNRYYEARALWHDSYMSYDSNEVMEELLRPIVDILEEMIVGKTVFEIACGTGNWTQILAKRAATVLASDISPTAMEIARKKLSICCNVSTILSDAYDLGNIHNRFDVLFAADWWSHIPKQCIHGFLENARIKLHPRSTAIFIDMSFSKFFEEEPCILDNARNRVSIRKLPDGSKYRVVKNFPSESELRQILVSHARTINYYEFPTLRRWMLVFDTK